MKIKKINVSKDGQVFQTSSIVARGISASYASGSTIQDIDLSSYAKKDEVLWEKGAVDNTVIQKKHGLEVANPYETAIGLYNKAESGKTVFTVGIGEEDDKRKNAFAVLQDNSISATTANIDNVNSTNLKASNGDINDLKSANATLTNVTSQTITNNGKITTNQFKTNTLEAVSGYIQTLLSEEITTDYLEVTKAAHFFSLVIDEVKAVGGRLILTPASCELHHVEQVNGGYKCYFRAKDGDKQIHQEFAVNDQVICQTFNIAAGTSYNVSNTYYWRLCTSVSSTAVEVDGVQYHWIVLSDTDKDKYSNSVPKQGDKLVQLGNRSDTQRQAAIILSAYNDSYLDPEIKAPSLVQYNGINTYELKSHRINILSKGLNQFKGAHLNNDGKNIDSKIDDLSTTVTNKVSEINQTIDGIGTRVSNTETSIKTVSGDVLSVSSTTNSNSDAIKNNSDAIKDNADAIKDNSDAIDETNKTLTSLTKTVKDNYSALDQKADEINATVSANTNSITTVSNSLGEVKKSVDKNTEDIASLDVKADKISATVSENTSSITSVSDSLGTLKKTVETNTKNIASLDVKADGISATVSSHTTTIDGIDKRVTTNTDDISKIKQTSSSITSTVESIQNNYATKSELQQTASSITASVNDTFIKIGDTNITLGGDTVIEGNLTLTKSDQGFTLIGDGGTTDIMAKSIGTYADFKNKSSKTIFWRSYVDCIGGQRWGTSYIDFSGESIKSLGTVKVGDVINLEISYLSLWTTNEWNGSSYNGTRSLGGTYKLSVYNGTTLVKDYGTIKQNDNITYTSTFNGELRLRIQASGSCPMSYWEAQTTQLKPMPSARFQWNVKASLPTSAYMLIGYDGWAVNFGSNKTVYCGNEGFIANYGEKTFKITSDGIVMKPEKQVKIVSGGSTTTWYTVPSDGSVDTVFFKGINCGVKLPLNPYEGMHIRVLDRSDKGFLDTNGKYLVFENDDDYNTTGTKYSGEQYELSSHHSRGYIYVDGKWWEELYHA